MYWQIYQEGVALSSFDCDKIATTTAIKWRSLLLPIERVLQVALTVLSKYIYFCVLVSDNRQFINVLITWFYSDYENLSSLCSRQVNVTACRGNCLSTSVPTKKQVAIHGQFRQLQPKQDCKCCTMVCQIFLLCFVYLLSFSSPLLFLFIFMII